MNNMPKCDWRDATFKTWWLEYCDVLPDTPEAETCWDAKVSLMLMFERGNSPNRLYAIRDIEPYQAMGIDIATGKAPIIGSRSYHREYLKRNNYTEIGNEMPKPRTEQPINTREIGQQIKHIIDQKGIKL